MKKEKKDTIIRVEGSIGETVLPLVTRINERQFKLNCDAYLEGSRAKGGFYNLHQARKVIPGKKLGNNLKFWPRLRRALHEAGLKTCHVPGGAYPLHYDDEIVIPDYSMNGTHYFIIKYSDIGNYLNKLPLDEKGKAHAEEIARREAEAKAEAYRQAHDPKCIANRIGNELWHAACLMPGEFKKISLVDNGAEFSIIYPENKTDLIWNGAYNVAKVICSAPETGIEFLSGWTAGHLAPEKHNRLKKVYYAGWGTDAAYLMPNPNLATETREHCRWLGLFDNLDNDGVAPDRIASAKKVVLEAYDLNDKLLKQRYVYDAEAGLVTKEFLRVSEVTGEFEWCTEN